MKTIRRAGLAVCLAATSFGAQAAAQIGEPVARRRIIVSDGHTRIVDPKLAGGGVDLAFHLEPVGSVAAQVRVLDGTLPLETLWTGTLAGAAPRLEVLPSLL